MEKARTKRRIQAEESRENIFNTAIKLFSERGYESVTVEQICKAAKVSVGGFYHYYKSKASVFDELHERLNDHFLELVQNTESIQRDTERVLRYFECFAETNEYIGPAIVTILLSIGNDLQNQQGSLRGYILDSIVHGQSTEEFEKEYTAEEITNHLIFATKGLLHEWCFQRGTFSLKEKMHQFVQIELRCFSAT